MPLSNYDLIFIVYLKKLRIRKKDKNRGGIFVSNRDFKITFAILIFFFTWSKSREII